MVWLHGGGYAGGSVRLAVYDGTELARKHDVVVVTVNHRLNVFGFLYLAEIGHGGYAPGRQCRHARHRRRARMGARQHRGVRRRSAERDVFGQSGGAGKVSTLMAMPSAKGLFHRAIAQSGAALTGVSRADATATTRRSSPASDPKATEIDRLHTLPAAQLLGAISGRGRGGQAPVRLAPVVDGCCCPATRLLRKRRERPSYSIAHRLNGHRSDCSRNHHLQSRSTTPGCAVASHRCCGSTTSAPGRSRHRDLSQGAARKGDQRRPLRDHCDRCVGVCDRPGDRSRAAGGARESAGVKYDFSWFSPIHDGKLRSFHTLEIPFVFDHVDEVREMTGTGTRSRGARGEDGRSVDGLCAHRQSESPGLARVASLRRSKTRDDDFRCGMPVGR